MEQRKIIRLSRMCSVPGHSTEDVCFYVEPENIPICGGMERYGASVYGFGNSFWQTNGQYSCFRDTGTIP